MAAHSVRVIVPPLTVKPLYLETGIFHHTMYREGHVRVYVPILQTMNDVYRSLVILNRSLKEVPFFPIIRA
jgi:hypothetical protein